MASAIAWRLHMANIRRICMTELDDPLCVRRTVSFSSAMDTGVARVEGVAARLCRNGDEIRAAWQAGQISVVPQTHWSSIDGLKADVVIDAILAKRNVATHIADAPLVIALGPGFFAGKDCHLVIETNRGHHLGRIISEGAAEPNSGVPGDIAGHTAARVLRAPADGMFVSDREIGDKVAAGEAVGEVSGQTVVAELGGTLRGLIRPGTRVSRGLKIGDIDPRAIASYCQTISDKARAISGSVLEGVMRHCNLPAAG